MLILKGDDDLAIGLACELLKKGEVVAFPTETVYGLGADALNPYAVAKIFEIKKRPHFDPIIVHVADLDWVKRIVRDFPEEVRRITNRFWPGPLTVILEKNEKVPDIVTAGLPTVGIRMPSHPVARKLIDSFGGPIAAPSANPFGYISPTRASHVARLLKEKISLVIDGGEPSFGIESTVISVRDGKIYIYRFGALTLEELSEFGEIIVVSGESKSRLSPGRLPYHYAPNRPLKIVESIKEIENPSSSFLAFMEPKDKVNAKYVRVLTKTGDLREAASNFFSFLIELDREDVEIIYAEKVPEKGLGRAIMERLKKAERKTFRT